MNAHFIYNFVAKTIVGSKRSIERANKGLNPEYTELTQMLAAQPTFTVTEKIINKKNDKKTYSKLTFGRMREYISLAPDSEVKLSEFEAVMAVAETRGAKYPLTKKWFLSQYPEFKETEVNLDLSASGFENGNAA